MKKGLKIVGGSLLAAWLALNPGHALAQNKKDVPAFGSPSIPGNALQDIQAAYPAVKKNGYTYIKMDHVRPGGSAATDVTTLRLSYRNGNDPQNDPLIVVNYSAEGYPKSEQQSAFLERALPLLVKRSQRPIVFIDVTALKKDKEGMPENVHMASLLSDQENNKLEQDGSSRHFADGQHVLPYGYAETIGNKMYDFSFSLYEPKATLKSVQRNVLGALGDVVATSNGNTAAPSVAQP